MMPRPFMEILSPARAELARGRPRAALRELEAARAELLAAGDAAGLSEALELTREVRTLAPVDTKSREHLIAALERDIASLSPGAGAQPTPAQPAAAPTAPSITAGQYLPYGGAQRKQILAPTRAALERRETRRALRSLEKARRKLLDRSDFDGLCELLVIAQRITTAKARHEKARGLLIDATQQNVRYLGRRAALKAGEEWSDPFAGDQRKPALKLPSLPPMSRREILIAAGIVVLIAAGATAWAFASRVPQRAAHALKCPTGEQGSPTWSPGGKRIAFAKNGSCGTQITIISAKGGPTRELTGRYGVLPDWSPDGRTILYRSSKGFSTISVDGGKSHLLRSDDGDMGAVWSPDGREIAYTHGLPPDFGGYSSTTYVMQSDGSGSRRIIDHSCNPGTPAWSPRGRELAFACSDGVYTSDLSSGKISYAAGGLFEFEDEYGDINVSMPPKVSWSPDGLSLAYGWEGVNVTSRKSSTSSFADRPESAIAQVESHGATTIDVAWAPNGEQIAYSVVGSDAEDGLYVVDRDGKNRRLLIRF
jgi:hypothetical protein